MAVTLILRNPLDGDAREYISRAGVTDSTARIQLNEFVRGVKNLGLWANMVCWPLRSAQNSGGADPTNTTVYSLGGLGTYNGTRVNGPAWGANGIDFTDESNEHVLTTFTPAVTDDFYMFAAYEGNAQGTSNNVIASTRTAGIVKGFTLASQWANVHRALLWTDAAALEAVGSGGFTDGSYNTTTMRGGVSGATLTAGIAVNTGAETTASVAGTVSAAGPIMLGNEAASGPRSLGGILCFAAYFKSASINTSAFRSLYKSTLGTGLGLP